MDLTLPTWWVIQLACRLTVGDRGAPLHLDCVDPLNATDHQLYYRCRFETAARAHCHTTDPPLSATPHDQQSFAVDRDFPRTLALDMLDSGAAPAWLTLPPFVGTSTPTAEAVPVGATDARLRCNRDADSRFTCTLVRADDTPAPWWARYDWWFLFVIAFIAAGGVGNILVCLAICLDRRLQNVTNYFLLSLAVADLLVSLFVMPLGAIQGFFGYWPLGIVWCNIYITCDVMACSCSIMHMCCISLGRYMGIRNPLKTRQAYGTKRLVGIKIAIVWSLSLVVASSVTVLGLMDTKNIMPEPHTCAINNRAFFVFGSLVAFYIPMVIMVLTYVLTVQLLRKKARFLQDGPVTGEPHTFRRLGGRFRKQTAKTPPALLPQQSSPPRQAKRAHSTPQHRTLADKDSTNSISSSQPSLSGTSRSGAVSSSNGKTCDTSHEGSTSQSRNSRLRTLRLPLNVTPSNLNIRFLANRNKRQNVAAVANAVRTEQKASKVLGLVFFTFVFCWAPFFLLNIVFAICPKPDCEVPANVIDITLWLGYVSSTINPIIYTIFNRTFRAAFISLLKCQCKRLSHPTRYRSVNENRNSALLTQTPSSAAAGAAALPLSLSLQCTPITPSSGSSLMTNVRSPPPIDEVSIGS